MNKLSAILGIASSLAITFGIGNIDHLFPKPEATVTGDATIDAQVKTETKAEEPEKETILGASLSLAGKAIAQVLPSATPSPAASNVPVASPSVVASASPVASAVASPKASANPSPAASPVASPVASALPTTAPSVQHGESQAPVTSSELEVQEEFEGGLRIRLPIVSISL